MATIKIATCSYPGTNDVNESLERHLAYIDEAAAAGCALVVFPEISLQGYPPLSELFSGRYPFGTVNKMTEGVYQGAQSPEHGPHARRIAERAIRHSIHVIYGLTESGDQPTAVYNTSVLTGPEGYIGAYRKVHVHPVESFLWRSGHDFPVFSTAIGTIGIMTCYDKWWPESARELTLRGADILVAPAAWGGRRPDRPEATDFLDRSFCLYDRVRALENSRWLVSSNYFGDHADDYFCGQSAIVDPLGNTVASTGSSSGLAIAEIDVAGGMQAAAATVHGSRLIRDRHPEAYRALSGELATVIDG